MHAVGCAYPTHRRALERAYSPHRRALMRACLLYRRAPRAHLTYLLMRTHARFFSVQVHAHACLPLSRLRMWAPPLPKNPLKLPYDPPYLPCPKIGNL
jgi:hypothetical protein